MVRIVQIKRLKEKLTSHRGFNKQSDLMYVFDQSWPGILTWFFSPEWAEQRSIGHQIIPGHAWGPVHYQTMPRKLSGEHRRKTKDLNGIKFHIQISQETFRRVMEEEVFFFSFFLVTNHHVKHFIFFLIYILHWNDLGLDGHKWLTLFSILSWY